jgi:hypothetical protein
VVVREIIFNYHCAIRCVVSYINVAFFFFFFLIETIGILLNRIKLNK